MKINSFMVFCLIVGCAMFACKKNEIVEQTVFENIPTCCKLFPCDYKDPAIAKLHSDSVIIKNATAVLTEFGVIGGLNIKNNYVDPKRFPGWNNRTVSIYTCNMPEKLRKQGSKSQNIELDFTLFYFIPPVSGDYSGYPVDLIRVKILPN